MKNTEWDMTDVVGLFNRPLDELAAAAERVKARRFGRRVTWVNNCHINYTNICEGSCLFCRYRRGRGDDDAFTLGVQGVVEQVAGAVERGAREVHIVGGLNADLDWDYYVALIEGVRKRFKGLYIKAFTAVEIDFMAERFGLGAETVLDRLREAGLDCLAGGGAEIFADRVRQAVCPAKIRAERWLEIHRVAHGCGLASNATMLFGHAETAAERGDHLRRLRVLQDQTGGFRSFLPFPAVGFEDRPIDGIDALKTLAIGRLVLDNIDHIKVFWPIWTAKLAQLGLSYGADDFDGTVGSYRIVDSGRLGFSEGMAPKDIRRLIGSAGYEVVERNGEYGIGD